jgi:hypothetical protein
MKLIGNVFYDLLRIKKILLLLAFLVLIRFRKPDAKGLQELDDHKFEVMAGNHKIIMGTPVKLVQNRAC